MKKVLQVLLLFIIFISKSVGNIHAENEFSSSYTVTYTVAETGVTSVTQNIDITNTTSNYYVSEYFLTISSTKIRNIKAVDGLGPLKLDIKLTDNQTEIKAIFNEKVAGLGKTLHFSLSYISDDIASHNGNIWDINIPRLAKSEGMTSYLVNLQVPDSFGSPTYVYPSSISKALQFSKDQLEKNGITVTFGSYQMIDFTLKYYLENEEKHKVFMEIALPPQTAYQEIWLDKLDPKPESVYLDEDGNWLAKYILNSKETINIEATGTAKLYLKPQRQELLSKEEREMYLRPQKYWEADNPKIIELAQKLKTPKQIYDYVVKTLSYDYSRVNENTDRFGALKALSNPSNAVCMEFTDLFITLARAIGIPARENNGYAYTNNEKLRPISKLTDVLHSWPEYWSDEKQVWIPVDPTWENTTSGIDYFNKLDFNHFVFVTKGKDSEYPFPAGSYKEAKDKKSVIISFGSNKRDILPETDVTIKFPEKAYSGFPLEGKVTVINKGNTLFTGGNIKIQSTPFGIISLNPTVVPFLPPYGTYEIPLSINNNKFLFMGKNIIDVDMNGYHNQKEIQISSLFTNNSIQTGIAIIVLSLIGIMIYFMSKWIRR